MGAGGFDDPAQFEAVDDGIFVVHLHRPSKLSLPDLAVPVPFIIDSEVARANVNDDDPWAMEYLHTTAAGSGAFKVAQMAAGPAARLRALRRLGRRRAAADPARRRPRGAEPRDAPGARRARLADGAVAVFSTPIENCIHCVGLNYSFEPFQDPDVRKAVAYAIPYDAIFRNAAYGRGAPLWGGAEGYDEIAWPRPSPYSQDLEKAKAHLAASGYAREALLDVAQALGPFDAGKPLWGVPFTVEDNIDVAGMPTTAGCPAYADDAREDAVVVERLCAAGRYPSARPTSTSSRPASSASARPTACRGRRSIPRSCRAALHRARRYRWRRDRALRTRHRHGRVGPGARGAQRRRRAQAEPRHGLHLRPDGRRRAW